MQAILVIVLLLLAYIHLQLHDWIKGRSRAYGKGLIYANWFAMCGEYGVIIHFAMRHYISLEARMNWVGYSFFVIVILMMLFQQGKLIKRKLGRHWFAHGINAMVGVLLCLQLSVFFINDEEFELVFFSNPFMLALYLCNMVACLGLNTYLYALLRRGRRE